MSLSCLSTENHSGLADARAAFRTSSLLCAKAQQHRHAFCGHGHQCTCACMRLSCSAQTRGPTQLPGAAHSSHDPACTAVLYAAPAVRPTSCVVAVCELPRRRVFATHGEAHHVREEMIICRKSANMCLFDSSDVLRDSSVPCALGMAGQRSSTAA